MDSTLEDANTHDNAQIPNGLDTRNLIRFEHEISFREQLDLADAEQRRIHRAAIEEAAAIHERIRADAVKAKEAFDLELELQELQRQRDAEAEYRQLERALEYEREQQQAQRRQDAVERRAAAERLAETERQAEEARKAERERRAEIERRAEAERKAEAERQAAAAQKAQTAQSISQPEPEQPTAPQTQQARTTNGALSTSSSKTALHAEYLALHRRLKNFRKRMADIGKQNKQLKNRMGDDRRELNKKVGQMTSGESQEVKLANRDRVRAVRDILQNAMAVREPQVDVREFFVPSRQVSCSDSEAQISGLFIYLVNQLSKIVIRQYVGEAGISPEKAEAVGLLIATIFGQRAFQWNGTTYLIDILLAKYHLRCPALFGVNKFPKDPESTLQQHLESITGLGAGYAALTLRDFSKSQAKNPMPVSMLWNALASIINTPPTQITDEHFTVLKGLLHPDYVRKFIRFYGDMAIALLRQGIIGFTEGKTSSSAQALKSLSLVLGRDLDIVIQ